jgi:hypothetical protein
LGVTGRIQDLASFAVKDTTDAGCLFPSSTDGIPFESVSGMVPWEIHGRSQVVRIHETPDAR